MRGARGVCARQLTTRPNGANDVMIKHAALGPQPCKPVRQPPPTHLDWVLLRAVLQEPAVDQWHVTSPPRAPAALAEGCWCVHEGDAAGCAVTVQGGLSQEGLHCLWQGPRLKLVINLLVSRLTL